MGGNHRGGLDGRASNRPWTRLVNPNHPERWRREVDDLDEGTKTVYEAQALFLNSIYWRRKSKSIQESVFSTVLTRRLNILGARCLNICVYTLKVVSAVNKSLSPSTHGILFPPFQLPTLTSRDRGLSRGA